MGGPTATTVPRKTTVTAKLLPIHEIQGDAFLSPVTGQRLRARGVVTGLTKRGYFIQDPDGGPNDRSHAIFVYSPKHKPDVGVLVEVEAFD